MIIETVPFISRGSPESRRAFFSALTGGRFGAEPAESGSDQEEAAGHIATGAVRVDVRVDRGTWLNRFLWLKPIEVPG